MTFKETFLYKAIMHPVNYAESFCFYYYMLVVPCIIVWLVVSIPLAIVFDFIASIVYFISGD